MLLKICYLLWLIFPQISTPFNISTACNHIRSYHFILFSKDCYPEPDVFSTVPEIIERYGYSVETYDITTADGYILTMFRIPPDKKGTEARGPVFLQHGAFTNSVSWTVLGRRSLAFALADRGYDVWLSNLRGTKYSSRHLYKSIEDRDYWAFSIDTLAEHDVRESLKFVSTKTGNKGDIIYIGMSMGTTTIFMYASEHPDEVELLLRGAINLAPVAYFENAHPLIDLGNWAPAGFILSEIFGIKSLRPSIPAVALFNFIQIFYPETVLDGFNIISGNDTNQFSETQFLMLSNQMLDAISIRVLHQYFQITRTNVMRKYDLGPDLNQELYGSPDPPQYDFGRITIPMYLLYGKNDRIAMEENVMRLFRELGSREKYVTEIPRGNEEMQFNHNNFILSKYIEDFLYIEIFDIMENRMKR